MHLPLLTLTLSLFLFSSHSTLLKFPLIKQPLQSPRFQGTSQVLSSTNDYDLEVTNTFWVTQIPFNNIVIPFTPLLYTNETWIAGVDQPQIKAIPCTGNTQCTISDTQKTEPLLTYNITGNVTTINGHQAIYTSEVDFVPPTQISGGLGLGVSNSPGAMSYLSTLQDGESIFSIYISRNFIQSSNIAFGGYDSSYIIHNANFITLYPVSPLNWTFHLTQVASQGLDSLAIFDQNIPYIGIPQSIYTQFVKNFTLQNHLDCILDGVIPTCNCNQFDNLPNLDLSLSGTYVTLPPSAYSTSGDKQCTLLFTPVSSDNSTAYSVMGPYSECWILGEPFMSYYYLVFYYEAGYLDIVQSAEVSTSTLAWILLILLCSIIFIGVIVYRYRKLSAKKDKKSQENNEQQSVEAEAEAESKEKGLQESLLTKETEPMTIDNLEGEP